MGWVEVKCRESGCVYTSTEFYLYHTNIDEESGQGGQNQLL